MSAPLNFEEGQSLTRAPGFIDQFYSWWNTTMHDFLMNEDSELWNIVVDSPFIPTIRLKDGGITRVVHLIYSS